MNQDSRLPVVLITGASSGLGLAIAQLLSERPYHLVLTARASSLARFTELGIRENEHLWIRPLDVTNGIERRLLIREIDQHLGGVDILINNAGFAYRAVLEHVTREEYRRQMETNFEGPMDLCRLVLPLMRERGRGRIINISSVGGMMAMPTMAPYSASKFALEGASESLWYEVRPWNIFVTLIQPGFINSDSFQRVRLTALGTQAMTDRQNPYHQHYRYMSWFIELLMRYSPARSSSVAQCVLRVLDNPKPPLRVIATLDAHLFTWLRRMLPRRLYHAVLYNLLPGVIYWGRKYDRDH